MSWSPLSRDNPFLFQNRLPLLRKVLVVLSAFLALKTPFLFLFLLDWAQGCRAKVRYRSSNTPAQLSFAPEDSQIHEPWCRCSSLLHAGVKNFFSLWLSFYIVFFHSRPPTWDTMAKSLSPSYLSDFIWVAHSHSLWDCSGICPTLPFARTG